MRSHGTRACYVFGPVPGQKQGCRCEPCRQANRDYARLRERRRANPDIWGQATDFVPAIEALEVIEELRNEGLGLRTIAHNAGLGRAALQKILRGETDRVRGETLRRLQQLAGSHRPEGLLVGSRGTWHLIGILRSAGYSKARIAGLLGIGRSLQIGKGMIRLSTARKVQALYAQLWAADPRVRLVPGAATPLGRAA